jgi:hypothetical protein
VPDLVRSARERDQDRRARDRQKLRLRLSREVDKLGRLVDDPRPLGEQRDIRAKFESICATCGRRVNVGEVVSWFYEDVGRTLVCRVCMPGPEPRRAGVKNKKMKPGSGTSFRDWLREQGEKT